MERAHTTEGDHGDDDADLLDEPLDGEEDGDGGEGEFAEPEAQPSLVKTLLQPQNRQVGRSLAVSMALMVVVPLSAFYVAHHFFLPAYFPDSNERLTYSGLIAVLAVKVVSSAYAIAAFREERRDREEEAAAAVSLDAEARRRLGLPPASATDSANEAVTKKHE